MSERRYDLMVESFEKWFAREQRPLPWRESYDPYHVWVAEVMAQQTRMEVVVPYWVAFIEKFPSLENLAAADEDSVMAAWSGLGYYRRARMLREGAIEVLERYQGKIPDDPAELETIRGIGPYTAGAIASIAFDRPAPIVDGNILRVFSRLTMIDEPLGSKALERECRSLAGTLVSRASSPRNLSQGLMELGATVCTPKNPECSLCPVSEHCAAARAGLQGEFPRPRKHKETVDLVVPVYVVSDPTGRIMLIRSSEGPLLEGMFRLPGEDRGITAAVGGVERRRRRGEVRHAITNQRIRFEVWDATITSVADGANGEVRWVHPAELDSVPHPSWVRKAIELGVG